MGWEVRSGKQDMEKQRGKGETVQENEWREGNEVEKGEENGTGGDEEKWIKDRKKGEEEKQMKGK